MPCLQTKACHLLSFNMRAGLIFSLIIFLKNALCWKNVTLIKIHTLEVQQSAEWPPPVTLGGICRDVNLRSPGGGECRRPVGVQGAVCQRSDYHLTHTDTSQWRWQRNFMVNDEHNIWIRCLLLSIYCSLSITISTDIWQPAWLDS